MEDFSRYTIKLRVVDSDKLGSFAAVIVSIVRRLNSLIDSCCRQFDVWLLYRDADLWPMEPAFLLPNSKIERTYNAQTHLLS